MPPPRQRDQNSAQLGGQASVDGERPGPAPSAARKGMTSTSRRRPSRGHRSGHAKSEEPGRIRPGSDHQASFRAGSQLPDSRVVAPPETQWDFDERQDARATSDDDSLKRNIRWQWHRTAQRLVIYAGPSGFALVVFVLTRELGLAPQAAVRLSLACLASATAGHFSRELLITLSGKRRSRHHRSEDEVSRNEDGRSS
jgi:hypothetical protein